MSSYNSVLRYYPDGVEELEVYDGRSRLVRRYFTLRKCGPRYDQRWYLDYRAPVEG